VEEVQLAVEPYQLGTFKPPTVDPQSPGDTRA